MHVRMTKLPLPESKNVKSKRATREACIEQDNTEVRGEF